jgi:hypothetical protein
MLKIIVDTIHHALSKSYERRDVQGLVVITGNNVH